MCRRNSFGFFRLADRADPMTASIFGTSSFLIHNPFSVFVAFRDYLTVFYSVTSGTVDRLTAIFCAGGLLINRIVGFPAMTQGVNITGFCVLADRAGALFASFIGAVGRCHGFPFPKAVP